MQRSFNATRAVLVKHTSVPTLLTRQGHAYGHRHTNGQVFNQFIDGGEAMHHLKLKNIKAIVADTTAIVSSLHNALPKRQTSPLSKDGGGAGNASPGAGAGFGQVSKRET